MTNTDVPEGVQVTDRGFWHWPWIRPASDPASVIQFYESSALLSGSPNGEVEGPFAWLAISEHTRPAHLTYDEVKTLRDQFNQWLEFHAGANEEAL